MRSSFAMMMGQGPQVVQQIETTCKQSVTGMRQAMASMNCK
jgi:hypothetical protein